MREANNNIRQFVIDFGIYKEEVQVVLRNQIGQIISSQSILETSTVEMEIEGAPGLYILELHDQNGAVKSFKIVKN